MSDIMAINGEGFHTFLSNILEGLPELQLKIDKIFLALLSSVWSPVIFSKLKAIY